jgi:hypothetical protein
VSLFVVEVADRETEQVEKIQERRRRAHDGVI